MSRLCKTLPALLLIAVCLLPGAATAATPAPRHCHSSDLRYSFTPGGPRAFGVFGLRVADGSCATAHRVAREWMRRFEAALRAGHTRLPGVVDGFRFTTLPVPEVQAFPERGRRGASTIWFDYRIPNG